MACKCCFGLFGWPSTCYSELELAKEGRKAIGFGWSDVPRNDDSLKQKVVRFLDWFYNSKVHPNQGSVYSRYAILWDDGNLEFVSQERIIEVFDRTMSEY